MSRCKADFPTLPTPELRLYHSREKCGRFLAAHDVDFEPYEDRDAQTWMFSDNGCSYAVVLFEAGLAYDYDSDMSLLAHEATHVSLYAFRCMGEDEPAEEEFCYMVQAITGWLCKSHFEWKRKKLAKAGKEVVL